jgi:hypothetical protein
MHGAAGLDATFDEPMEAGGGGVLDHPHANSTNAFSVRLRRYHNQSLVRNSPAYSAFLRTAQIGFVDFHPTRQSIATGSNHRAPQFVQPRPGGAITTQSEHPL